MTSTLRTLSVTRDEFGCYVVEAEETYKAYQRSRGVWVLVQSHLLDNGTRMGTVLHEAATLRAVLDHLAVRLNAHLSR